MRKADDDNRVRMSAGWRSGPPLQAMLVAVVAAGCGGGDDIPEGPGEIGIEGRWSVRIQECPGECPPSARMGEWAEAVVEFSDTLVVFGDTECRAPVYRAALQLAEASSEPPSDDVDTAAPESGLSSLEGGRLVRIDCSGVRWRSPAAVLIVESSTSVRAMWEGSILRLERPS